MSSERERELELQLDQLRRGVPFHVHRCLDGDHEWSCNNPYCAVLLSPCKEHGGEVPTRA